MADQALQAAGGAHVEGDVVAPVEAPKTAGARPRGLSERERGVLALERRRWRHQGAKEQAVRDELGLSAARYHQLLNALLDDPLALAAEPVLVGRLRRLREERTDHLPS